MLALMVFTRRFHTLIFDGAGVGDWPPEEYSPGNVPGKKDHPENFPQPPITDIPFIIDSIDNSVIQRVPEQRQS